MMEEFQFTGDTPALYYAQAAWEYKHNNAQKAEDWTNSANKIYSPALNGVFADAFYDVGWLQRPEGTTAPAVAFDTGNVATSQTDGGPAVEPSPIPDKGPAANKQGGTLALAPSTSAPDGGMELAGAGATANQTSLTGSAPETNSPAEPSVAQSPSTSSESTTASQPAAPETTSASTVSSDQNQAEQQPVASETASASTVASSQNQTEQQPVAQTSPPEQQARDSAGQSLVVNRCWRVEPQAMDCWRTTLGGRGANSRGYPACASPGVQVLGPGFLAAGTERRHCGFKARTAPAHTIGVQGNGFAGGPRQVSLAT
jgi:hypothetical protein